MQLFSLGERHSIAGNLGRDSWSGSIISKWGQLIAIKENRTQMRIYHHNVPMVNQSIS